MISLTGGFEVTAWDEHAYLELANGRKLTRAEVKQRFTGGVTGMGRVVWLMCYAEDGTARFVGLQHIEGVLDAREGSFVVETSGDFDGEKAAGTWTVVPGSGAGGLAGIAGEGRFEAPRGPEATYSLDVTLA